MIGTGTQILMTKCNKVGQRMSIVIVSSCPVASFLQCVPLHVRGPTSSYDIAEHAMTPLCTRIQNRVRMI